MNNLRSFISRVLAKRQSQKPKLKAMQQGLRDLAKQLGHLRKLAVETSSMAEVPLELKQKTDLLSNGIATLESQIEDGVATTANLFARFVTTP
jgi:hypothetical protein